MINKENSEAGQTEVAEDASRKIRDSVDFTSQTRSARLSLFLKLDEDEQDIISEALISELRAIANGNFAFGIEPIAVSAQLSVDSLPPKSHRLNPLSLGAYTVVEEENELGAQSNFATNEHLTQH